MWTAAGSRLSMGKCTGYMEITVLWLNSCHMQQAQKLNAWLPLPLY